MSIQELYEIHRACALHFNPQVKYNAAKYNFKVKNVNITLKKHWDLLNARLNYQGIDPKKFFIWCEMYDRDAVKAVHQTFSLYREWNNKWGTLEDAQRTSYIELSKLTFSAPNVYRRTFEHGYALDIDESGALIIFQDRFNELISEETLVIWSLNPGKLQHWYNHSQDHFFNEKFYNRVFVVRDVLRSIWGIYG